MPTIGEQLRAARRARNLSLEDLSEATKIRPYMLRCLEDGEFDKFPDRFRLVSFTRQYAREVGLDADSAADAVRDQRPEPQPTLEEETSEEFPAGGSLLNERAISSLAEEGRKNLGKIVKAVVALLFIVLGAYWGFKLYQPAAGPSEPSDPTAEVTPAVSDEQEERAEPRTATVQSGTDSGRAGAPRPDPAPAMATASSEPRAGAMTVEILATDTVWLRSIADGTATREVTLNQGERHRVVADEVVQVLFGNAGGATVLIDGVRQDKVGELGQVRQIRITPEGWSHIRLSSR